MTSLKNIIKKYAPFIILYLLAVGIIFYGYMEIPKNTTFDEIEFAKLALKLDGQPPSPYSSYATGHATLYFYIILLSFKLFGIHLFSLRLPSAIFGTLCPLVFYLILKKIFPTNRQSPTASRQSPFASRQSPIANRQPPFASRQSLIAKYLPLFLSLVFLSLRWYFNFARFGFEVTFLLFLELCSLYSMYIYAEKKEKKYLVLSGLFAGLGYNSYQPGRVFAVIPLLLFFLTHINDVRTFSLSRIFKPLISFCIPFVLLILPLTIYLNMHKDIRFYQQFYPDNHEMTLSEKGQFFLRNLSSTAGIFNIKGDVNGRHNYPNKPALNPIVGMFFLCGLGIALIRMKEKNNLLFLSWFFLSLAPTLLTYPWENPNMLRTFTVLPSVVYFIGLSIQTLVSLLIFDRKKIVFIFTGFIILLFSLSSFYELRTYFVHQSEVFKEAFEAERDLVLYLYPSYEKTKK